MMWSMLYFFHTILVTFLCASSFGTSQSCENEIILHFNSERLSIVRGQLELWCGWVGIYVEIMGDMEFSSWYL